MSARVKLWHAIIAAVLAALGSFAGGSLMVPKQMPPAVPPPASPPKTLPEFDPPPMPPIPPRMPTPAGKEAIGRIQFGNAGCTATIIGPRRTDGRYDVLTAAHCVAQVGMVGTMHLRDGRTLTIRSVARDPRSDCCWCETMLNEGELPFMNLACCAPPIGAKLWHAGFGVDRPGNVEEGSVSGPVTPDGKLQMRMSVSSGDSGGGIILTETGEVVSCVCCTAMRGALATMFGAGPVAINKLRPSGHTALEWEPVPIPLVTEQGAARDLPPAP